MDTGSPRKCDKCFISVFLGLSVFQDYWAKHKPAKQVVGSSSKIGRSETLYDHMLVLGCISQSHHKDPARVPYRPPPPLVFLISHLTPPSANLPQCNTISSVTLSLNDHHIIAPLSNALFSNMNLQSKYN